MNVLQILAHVMLQMDSVAILQDPTTVRVLLGMRYTQTEALAMVYFKITST